MNLKIVKLDSFAEAAKRLYKKYENLPQDLKKLQSLLNENPKAGIDLGGNCYKLRLANSSIPTGKSGGFRVIYYYFDGEQLYLITIYSKRDVETIDNTKIKALVKKYGLDS